MLHLRNQQLYARENRISKPSPRSRRTVAQSPTERFAFSIFTPRSSFSLSPNPFSLCDFPRSSVHLRSQELVRPRRNGRSVAFWTRACSQEDTKEKFTSRLSVRSLSSSPSALLFFFDWFKFSDFIPFRCPCNHLWPCFGRTCRYAVSKIFPTFSIRQTNL